MTRFNPAIIDYDQANCRGINVDLFMEYEDHRAARRVCQRCPVAPDCYFEAVRDNLTGTWGGVWHGYTGKPSARFVSRNARKAFRIYQAIYIGRLGISRETFLALYGDGITGLRKALKAR